MVKAAVFTAFLLFCVGINAETCLEHVQELASGPRLLGQFRPVCQPNGDYAETQCHASTGYCFCVLPKTGEELEGTRIRGSRPVSCKATPCLLQRHNALKSGLIGAFQPQCEADGSFKKKQCHASTGYCFCVFPETGKKVLGTEIRFDEPDNCEMTECMKQRHEALSVQPPLLGAFIPKCASDGSYKKVQCHEGFCYCVFPTTGKEIMGTRLNVRGVEPKSCEPTPCVIQRHNVLNVKRPLLGAFKPECNEDGSYKPIQCHEGFCYCVFSNGDEILGTRAERGQKPLSCKITPCVLQRHKGWAQAKWGLLGVPIMRCSPYGKYDKVQCRKGMCWCVDPDTGKPIEGKPAQWTIPSC